MRERPIGDLVTGLKQLGADVDCFLGTNCPPVRVAAKGGLPGGKVKFDVNLAIPFYPKYCPVKVLELSMKYQLLVSLRYSHC